MDRCSQFIKNRALFGCFPTQEAVEELESHGVRYFIDLTTGIEDKTTPYTTTYKYMNYPIIDRRSPQNWRTFAVFILQVADIITKLKHDEFVYIHCKGGHGRSGVVVACLLCYLFSITPETALERTTKYHSKRSVMRDKWRELGSPQTRSQKSFVYRFFEPIRLYRVYKSGHMEGLTNFSQHELTIPKLGTFPTAEAAFQAFKNPSDSAYVTLQENAKSAVYSRHMGKSVKLRDGWDEIKIHSMKTVLKHKFEQHPYIKRNLLSTCLRPLINQSNDAYWGIGHDFSGENKMGCLLSSYRNSILKLEALD
jgi:ribA/ribD-fused uncharacterized protein